MEAAVGETGGIIPALTDRAAEGKAERIACAKALLYLIFPWPYREVTERRAEEVADFLDLFIARSTQGWVR